MACGTGSVGEGDRVVSPETERRTLKTARDYTARSALVPIPGTTGELIARGWGNPEGYAWGLDLSAPAVIPAGIGPMGRKGYLVSRDFTIIWERGLLLPYSGCVPESRQTLRRRMKSSRNALAVSRDEGVNMGKPIIPSGYSRVTGVEVEYYPDCGGTEEVAELMRSLVGAVGVVSDGSLRDGGVELRVMATEEHLERVLRKALKAAPGSVDKSCGLHVHLDMRMRDVELVWANLLAMESVITHSQPRQRILPDGDGGFCRPLQQWEKALGPKGKDRYRALNQTSLVKGTIEVRAHTGTANPDKILAWCDFLNAIADLHEPLPTPLGFAGSPYGQLLVLERAVGREFPYVRARLDKFAEGWASLGGIDPEGEE